MAALNENHKVIYWIRARKEVLEMLNRKQQGEKFDTQTAVVWKVMV